MSSAFRAFEIGSRTLSLPANEAPIQRTYVVSHGAKVKIYGAAR